MSKSKIEQFVQKISSFQQVARITSDLVPGDCKFVADPFIQYDSLSEQWVLFAEVAFPGRRQFIGMLTSPDLRSWQYHGDAVKGSRESFPCIIANGDHYLMTPCVDASPAPGLIAIYRSESLLGPWKLAHQLNLEERVNDRLILACHDIGRSFLIYGTRTKFGPALMYRTLRMRDEPPEFAVGRVKTLLRNYPMPYFKNRWSGAPRLTMRPAGGLIQDNDGYFLPIQGTRKGRYGECLALSYITATEKEISFGGFEFFDYRRFCQDFIGSHHFSFYKHKTSEVFVLDGHGKDSEWEVRVFAGESAV